MVGYFCFCRLRVDDTEAMCSESCEYSKDGSCDDGGTGSDFDDCAFGSDCEVGRGFLPSTNALSKQQLWCAVFELSPFPHSTFFIFSPPNTLYPHSDGRIVAHAQATYQVQVTSSVCEVCLGWMSLIDLIVSLLSLRVCVYPMHCDGFASLFPHPHVSDGC